MVSLLMDHIFLHFVIFCGESLLVR